MPARVSIYVKIGLFLVCLLVSKPAFGQNNVRFLSGQDTKYSPIITSVPFLNFTPDARAASLGDIGVATAPDESSVHWNNAKLAFIDNKIGASLSYTPWLSKLVDDMYITYLTGYVKLQNIQTISFSLRYFNLGDIFLTTENGTDAGTFMPKDFALDLTYARKLSTHFSLGGTMRFINSGLSRSYQSNNSGSSASGYAMDLGVYYTHPTAIRNGIGLAWGAHLSNVGTKLTYSDKQNENFIPTNLRVGTAVTWDIDDVNSFVFALDLNKLLVPSPPVYSTDEQGNVVQDADGNPVIEKGMDPNRSVINTLFTSFIDAPNGFIEELEEISISPGIQYWFNDIFSVQGGYHHESVLKGNRKYYTFGTGFRYNIFGIDFAYLLPLTRNHPLAQTLRFSMYIKLGQSGGSSKPEVPVTTSTISDEQY